jgi:hypothetical protein
MIMPFKVRDLMIDVAPGVGGVGFCRLGTCMMCTNQVTIITPCGKCSYFSPYAFELTPLITRITPTCGFSRDPTIVFNPTIVFDEPVPIAPNQFMAQAGVVANPQNLAELKAQLRQSLAQVEAQEQAMAESMKPQTVEEADMLEQKLTEALDELRQHKEELRRRSST